MPGVWESEREIPDGIPALHFPPTGIPQQPISHGSLIRSNSGSVHDQTLSQIPHLVITTSPDILQHMSAIAPLSLKEELPFSLLMFLCNLFVSQLLPLAFYLLLILSSLSSEVKEEHDECKETISFTNPKEM